MRSTNLWESQAKHAGSVLNKSEWVQAIADAAADLRKNVAPPGYQIDCALPDLVLAGLVAWSTVDKPYAWWSAHMHAALNPSTMADMPERLTNAINQRKL